MAARSTKLPAKPAEFRAALPRRLVASPSAVGQGDADTLRLLLHWRNAAPGDRFGHLVKDATRALVRALQRRLAVYGVPFGHWAFLRVLWRTDGLTQRELSREAGVMEPTTFGALKAMEERGYIVRRKLAGNRRKIHVFLTAKGRSLEAKLVPLAEEVNRIALRSTLGRDVAATRRTLLAVLENLARDEGDSGANAARVVANAAERRCAADRRRPRRFGNMA